ncbi:hypothetical protein UY3_11888 [Chelonia mydas]|uniref:Uncharacterized protein n=1 Tax=Chelonia mydas TaxID=8469 RepID=M7B618_CHEMY|nr:hypothetical protein UY3_11888 [Chelonia mydas]
MYKSLKNVIDAHKAKPEALITQKAKRERHDRGEICTSFRIGTIKAQQCHGGLWVRVDGVDDSSHDSKVHFFQSVCPILLFSDHQGCNLPMAAVLTVAQVISRALQGARCYNLHYSIPSSPQL